jgi:hypothetical protein
MRLRFGHVRSYGLLALASLCACPPFKADTRWLFSDATYSATTVATPPSPTSAELDLQVFSALELEAVMAYRKPAEMAKCLRAFPKQDIRALGEKLIQAGSKWASVAATIPLPPECAATGEPQTLVQFVLARIATAATDMATTEANTVDGGAHDVYDHVRTALDAIATLLRNTPTQEPPEQESQDAPVLALSGGAANGAFSAGFMFELLTIRERILRSQNIDGTGKYRFSALVATSVGALIAQILDLYFVDSKADLSPTQKAFVKTTCEDYWAPNRPHDACYQGGDGGVDVATSSSKGCFDGWPKSASTQDQLDLGLSGLDATTRAALFATRPRQMCALTKLYKYFTDDDEETLMCVESGPVTRMVSVLGTPTANFTRFDPMATNIIAPLLANFADELVANDMPRVVVSVESEDNQTVGLDERACVNMPSSGPTVALAPPGTREYCLGAGVMSSAVLPIFALGVRHNYDGVNPQGSCGTWFDGGLRSGFPVYRALRMSRPAIDGIVADPRHTLRVLAVGTGPLEGLPNTRPTNAFAVLLNTISQMSGQNEVAEVTLAQQMAIVRDEEILEMMGGARDAAPPAALDDDRTVSTIYVPTETPAYIVAAADYAFDRTLMRGLWVWGRHLAIERILGQSPLTASATTPPKSKQLFERLGWTGLARYAADYAKADTTLLQPWLDAFSIPTECPNHQQARQNAGQNRIRTCVPNCAQITAYGKDFPQYFLCPDNAGVPAIESRGRDAGAGRAAERRHP